MKKIIVIVGVLLILGYILYQNGPLWILQLLSLTSGSAPNAHVASGNSPKPPFKDGTYTGSPEDAFYGTVQVKAIVNGGKITDVQFVQYPNDRARSLAINTLAMPHLTQEAIAVQSANVDIVSGATDSSNAFMQSLASALTQAK